MKKYTKLEHNLIANNGLYYIYKNIASAINIEDLAKKLGVSKFHFHRIFKEQTGANIYDTIKNIRLQKAASLLITNKTSTITQIANSCGYSSHSSFIKAFKSRFNATPSQWRAGYYNQYSKKMLTLSKVEYCNEEFRNIKPKIEILNSKRAYYIRHKGYSEDIRDVWQKLEAWAYTNKITNYSQVAIYHDNPIITNPNEASYIASIVVNDSKPINNQLPYFEIPEGIYAKFETEGVLGDILKLINFAYNIWLPNSGYETSTNPSFSYFLKNHFLEDDERFKIEYYLPVQYL